MAKNTTGVNPPKTRGLKEGDKLCRFTNTSVSADGSVKTSLRLLLTDLVLFSAILVASGHALLSPLLRRTSSTRTGK